MSSQSKKILLHVCCAACASYVMGELEKEDYEITGFFYNPVVHGVSEYKSRLKDVESLFQNKGMQLIVPNYNIEEFLSRIMPFKNVNSIKYIVDKDRYRRRRCQTCISLLLGETFNKAQELKISEVSTTMLCSPFRDHDEIWNTGDDIAANKSMTFYYKDFRKGYWNGRNYARSHHLLVPKYCGCSESSEEGLLE